MSDGIGVSAPVVARETALRIEAEIALAEAQAHIARLEALLDRALEQGFDDMARVKRLEAAMSRYLPDAAHLYDCLIGPHHEKCTCGLDEARAALAHGKGEGA